MKFFGSLLLVGCLCALHSPAEAATLTITTTGPNAGTVGVIPTGQLCNPPSGGTCVFTIAAGTAVRIVANSPATPGIFSGGTGDAAGCLPTSTCAFKINSDSSITATFIAGRYPSVNIALAGAGVGDVAADNNRCQNFELGFSAPPCTVYYGMGSEVTLEGRSVPGNIFVNFSGGTLSASACSTTPCRFTLFIDSSVTANFAALASVIVTPTSPTINIGQTQSFTATGTFSNSATRSLQSGPGSWTTQASMSTPRFSLAAGVLNQRLYAVGGVDGGAPSRKVELYNPISNTWTTNVPGTGTPLALMLAAREGLAAAVLSGQLYALGGHTSGGGAISSVEAYDATSNAWTLKAPLSSPRAALAAAEVNGVLYAVGGGENVAPLDTLEAYVSGAWVLKTPMPTARRGLAAAAVNGLLYAIGGNNATASLATVEAYDPVTNTWIAKSPMPTPRTLLAVGVIHGLIYAVGGNYAGTLGTVEAYNPATDTWTSLGSMPTARVELAVGAFDGRLFAVGGMTGSDPSTSVSTHQTFRPPETTWWSSNPAVAPINQTAVANGLSAGTSRISARAVGIDCALTSGCATLTVSAPPPPPPPPPPSDCQQTGNQTGQCGQNGPNEPNGPNNDLRSGQVGENR